MEVEGNPVLLATHTYGPEAWVLAIGFRARIVGASRARRTMWRRFEGMREMQERMGGTNFAWEHDREFVRAALQGGSGER